ncbi:MAG: DUF4381 domain-containing protein [Gammaproteobacteria bacterium]|jgi:hypothetical protein|nr:DUF4381 domain-containing protein [Gammaproteobacteria bacterium]MDH3749141.1 DUF4381 domain-containing protein [Gammaproteobacteria bacterium]MDH3804615.1 DUF4381 domain-containing protein [Gammaproteobacteria bacterium]
MDPEQIPLRDLHLPEAIDWWPLAPGWWVVIALAAVGLAYLCRYYLRLRARGAARRHALVQLNELTADFEQHRNAVAFSSSLSELLRRTMLAYAPRHEVAGLTGNEWLAWLDRDLDRPRFQSDTGRKLLELPYRQPGDDVSAMDLVDVVAAVRQRLATPVGGQH